ncbi:hypothetical protein ACFV9C_23340 [Kribbella sp. NPDC059898]|uniref:hypothetical protein n=1 Tax=Kribbella sp. NPDC059898 TaxID=3346995 RepID=UPI00366965FB
MADQAEAAEQAARSPLDQAAADGSITQARTRAVDPVPIVAEMAVAGATLEPVLETNETDMGVSVDSDVQTVDGVSDGSADGGTAPVAGARRRLSPRPVPVSRRRRAPAATDEERTPAEEMDDVGTQDDKAEAAAEAAKAGSTPGTDAGAAASSAGGTTATKTVRPKTAAEIVAEQRARESAAASAASSASAGDAPAAAAGSEDAAAGTAAAGGDAEKPAATGATAAAKPPAKPSGASGNKPPASKSAAAGSGKGKQALTSVGSGVRKLRNLIASLIWLIAVLAAAVLALGALFTALDQTNQSNEIVRWILERGHDLVGPFKDLFRLQTAKNSLLVNWGIAALVYLIAGKIVEKIIRP